MKRKFFIFLMLLSSFSAFAQLKNEQKQILEGKWVFESVSAFEENVQIPFSVENIYFEIPVEMDIQQDEVTFIRKGGEVKVKYDDVVRRKSFCFPICGGWEIVDSKLQLNWGQDTDSPTGGTIIRTIVLSYSRK